MAQIGTLVGGAGAVTTISGLSQCDQYIIVGGVTQTPWPIRAFQVEVNGETIINISDYNIVQAFSKWLMEACNGVVGQVLKVSTGRIKGNTTIRFTNDGASTPAIYAFSDNDGGRPIVASTKTILPSSYEDFVGFDALIINPIANIQQAILTFADGFVTTVTANELQAYFALENQADSNGLLGVACVLDNRSNRIQSVRLFAVTGNLTVLQVSIPEDI